MEIDFGAELRPHELVAVGYDIERNEVSRTKQWINLPRQPAEAVVVVEAGENGHGATARVSWKSVVGEQPKSITVTFDGRPLAVTDPRAFGLPSHDPEALHFIRVELDFSDTVSSLAEITFGGAYADNVSTELTAVPILLGDSVEPPDAEALRSVSRKSSRQLSVVAVEKGPAALLIVLDESAKEALRRFGKINSRDLEHLIAQEYVKQTGSIFARGNSRELKKISRSGSARKVSRSFLRERAELSSDLQLQFLWPFAERQIHQFE